MAMRRSYEARYFRKSHQLTQDDKRKIRFD